MSREFPGNLPVNFKGNPRTLEIPFTENERSEYLNFAPMKPLDTNGFIGVKFKHSDRSLSVNEISKVRGFPMESAYRGFPYRGFPYRGFAYGGFPYGGFPCGGFPYRGFPYRGFPYRGFPYVAILHFVSPPRPLAGLAGPRPP